MVSELSTVKSVFRCGGEGRRVALTQPPNEFLIKYKFTGAGPDAPLAGGRSRATVPPLFQQG